MSFSGINLSIIIPVYNVETFIERCLGSLEDQDISEGSYEIICVNDGSLDASKEKIEGLKKLHKNIILITQSNQGVSRARNNGINIARGEYLLFVDPDDFVNPRSLSRILKNAHEHKAQVSFLGFTFLNEDGSVRKYIFNETHTSNIFSGIESYFKARGNGQTDPDRIWAILLKTEFINSYNLRFLSDVCYLEDGEFIARILCLAERCIFDGHPFYNRTTRHGSATNSELFYSEDATKGFLLSARNLKKFQQEQKLNEKQIIFLNQPIAKFVLLAINSSVRFRQFNKLTSTIQKLKMLSFSKIRIKGCNRRFRIFGKIYNLSPYLSAIALIIYPRIDKFKQSFNKITLH